MKKILLNTAVVIMASAVILPTAKAEGQKLPSLTISGEANGTYYAFKGSQREANGGRGNGHLVRAENTRLNFDVFGKAEGWGGLEYSYLLGLAGNTADGNNPVEENRIKLKGHWGTFMIGTHRGVDHVMPVGAYATTGATGGVLGGNYKEVINPTSFVNYSVDMVGTAKDVNRVTYVTPRINGFQFGASLAPQSNMKGESTPNSYGTNSSSKNLKPMGRNIVSLGLNFKKQIDKDWTAKLSAVSVFSRADPGTRNIKTLDYGTYTINPTKMKRAASYAVGGQLSYKDLDFGVEFIDNGKSFTYSDIRGADAGQVMSAGIGYKMDMDRISVGYLYGSKKIGQIARNGLNPTARASAAHITWDRTLAPGLNVYSEVNYFDFKTDQSAIDFQKKLQGQYSDVTDPVGNNHGHVIMGGVKVKF